MTFKRPSTSIIYYTDILEMGRKLQYVCLGLLLFSIALAYFLPRYNAGCVCTSKARLDGKTVVITGANTGIGKETALDLAKRGARVIMACRNLKKSRAALESIIAESKNDNVVLKQLDLASIKSIRLFAKELLESESRLDVLINNAAVAFLPDLQPTEDGLEIYMGVNHLGHYLLTNLLLGLLKKSAPARVVVVSSNVHSLGEISLEKINEQKNNWAGYAQSKLANILFTRELSKRLEGTGVTANSLHPGVIHTELQRHTGILNTLFGYASGLFKSRRQGAQTSIYLAVSKEVEGVSGLYFMECKAGEPSEAAQDDEMAAKLWQKSAELVGWK